MKGNRITAAISCGWIDKLPCSCVGIVVCQRAVRRRVLLQVRTPIGSTRGIGRDQQASMPCRLGEASLECREKSTPVCPENTLSRRPQASRPPRSSRLRRPLQCSRQNQGHRDPGAGPTTCCPLSRQAVPGSGSAGSSRVRGFRSPRSLSRNGRRPVRRPRDRHGQRDTVLAICMTGTIAALAMLSLPGAGCWARHPPGSSRRLRGWLCARRCAPSEWLCSSRYTARTCRPPRPPPGGSSTPPDSQGDPSGRPWPSSAAWRSLPLPCRASNRGRVALFHRMADIYPACGRRPHERRADQGGAAAIPGMSGCRRRPASHEEGKRGPPVQPPEPCVNAVDRRSQGLLTACCYLVRCLVLTVSIFLVRGGKAMGAGV